MKLPWEKKYFCWGIVAFIVIAASISFYMVINGWSNVWGVIKLIFSSLRPITYGLIMAYLLNPLMVITEKSVVLPVLKHIIKKNDKLRTSFGRGISITLSWAIICVLLLALTDMVVPEIYSSIEALIVSMPDYANTAIDWVSDILRQNPQVVDYLKNGVSGFTSDLTTIAEKIKDIMPNVNVVIASLSSGVYGALKTLLNLIIGVIVSVYILKDKEKFKAQSKKFIYSVMPISHANKTIDIFRLMHDKFGNFITGKIFDSVIIGILCYILLAIFKVPYGALVSVIVGVTNVIPFFGPLIGAIPTSLLILFANPVKCITFIIIIIVLQQFDGNILGPKILGSTTGVSSFWVMFSILVGSGLFGVWGMICGVPVFAVLYSLICSGCNNSLKNRGILLSKHEFEMLDRIDKGNKPVMK